MQWRGRRQSTNVEDRRSIAPGRMAVGVGGGVGTLLVILVLALLTGQDPGAILNDGPVNPPAAGPAEPLDEADDEQKQFVSVVLAETEDVWNAQFQRIGRDYEEPTMVLFRGHVESACGMASAAVGPFYCPPDHKLYLDLSFFDELKRFGAPGDFAQAYVIAHEVGHHVQTLLGTTQEVDAQRRRLGRSSEANQLSVRLELQADFLAGVWAHHARRSGELLDPGDLEEAMRAANAIGDDRLQRQGRGYVVPDSFTHGTSEQRIRWFRRGLESGDIRRGDTFSIPYDDL